MVVNAAIPVVVLPLALSPIAVLLLVQLYVIDPGTGGGPGVPEKTIAVEFSPLQTVWLVTAFTVGVWLTLNTCVAATAPHPFVTVYDIVVLPPAIPVTAPLLDTVPAAVFVLLQVPLPVASVRFIVSPVHTPVPPLMLPALARGFTVTTCDAYTVPHVLFTPYDIVVVPAATPYTAPLADTVPAAVFVLLQVPPPVPVAVNDVVPAGHTVYVPLMLPGLASAVTVTFTVCTALADPLFTVITNTSLPEYPLVGVYVHPVGDKLPPFAVAVAAKPPSVPCAGVVVTLHVSVAVVEASVIVRLLLIAFDVEFSHTVAVVPPVKDGVVPKEKLVVGHVLNG